MLNITVVLRKVCFIIMLFGYIRKFKIYTDERSIHFIS